MRVLQFATAAAVLVMTAANSAPAGAAGFCKLPDGSMGQQCVVATSGQVYGCVKDLKECGALGVTDPAASDAPLSKGAASPAPTPASPESQGLTRSRSNIRNN